MKKRIYFLITLLSVLLLSGCGGAADTEDSAGQADTASAGEEPFKESSSDTKQTLTVAMEHPTTRSTSGSGTTAS